MILHIDMDAFYASVEQRDRPELRGKPVVVGGSAEGRGVVCAASYEARPFGVHSAMSAAQAVRLCPDAIFIRPRMNRYAEVSRQIRDIFHRFTPLVQPLSLDEAFLDVTGSQRLFGSSEEIGRQIQQEVFDEVGLPCSVGVAPNKSLAKIASDLKKPRGFCVVPPDRIQEFLDPLPVGVVWGVGRVAGGKLKTYGIETIADLRQLPQHELDSSFGSWGQKLARLARGEDDRDVVPDRTAKSISHETTFRENVDEPEILAAWCAWLAEQVGRRLRVHQRKARTVSLKLRDSEFRTYGRSRSWSESGNATRVIASTAQELLREILDAHRHGRTYRLIGVGVKSIDGSEERQAMLFDHDVGLTDDKRDAVSDEIARKFGQHAIHPGSTLRLPSKRRDNPYEAQ